MSMPSTAAIASTFFNPSRLDRRAEDDVLVRPWGVFGLVAISVALVTGVGSHPGHPAAPEGRVLGFAHDRARFFRVVHTRDLYAHDALIQHERNMMNERLVDAHDR